MATQTESVDLVDGVTVQRFARAVALAAVISASAYVSIPIPLSPVPFTLQVLFVFLAGLILGPVWGPISMLLYLTAGAIGAPVFAGGTGGIGVFFADSGGYLLSYPVAAFAIGFAAHQGRELRDLTNASPFGLATVLAIGTVIIYGMGVPWLAYVLELKLAEAVVIGALYFIPFEIVKLLAAIAIVKSERLDVGP